MGDRFRGVLSAAWKLLKVSPRPVRFGRWSGCNSLQVCLLHGTAALVCATGIQARAQGAPPVTVTIQNDVPRLDTSGHIVDAHDGNLQFFAGRYYLYGTAYGATAGFSINNRFRVYSSPDLKQWTFEGELLKAPPDGVYYRPYVVYNPTTHKYVLWYNWYPKLWDGQVGVATSDTPIGPFIIANRNVQLSKALDHPGDGSLFVDHDHTAYFIYTVIGLNHSIFVEKLTPDYVASTGEVSPMLAKGCEAPALFRHQDTYYALFDSTCCFCTAGSGARVYTANSPLGPYTLSGNINRDSRKAPIIHAQQTFVASLPGPREDLLLWMGDRWGSRPDGVKGHDFQYWTPLIVDADGSVELLKETEHTTISIQLGLRRRGTGKPYVWPKKPDPNPVMSDPCNHRALSAREAGIDLTP